MQTGASTNTYERRKGAMFGFRKKDPLDELRKQYEACMAAAIELQQQGDIRGSAAKSEEAAEIERRLLAAKAKKD